MLQRSSATVKAAQSDCIIYCIAGWVDDKVIHRIGAGMNLESKIQMQYWCEV